MSKLRTELLISLSDREINVDALIQMILDNDNGATVQVWKEREATEVEVENTAELQARELTWTDVYQACKELFTGGDLLSPTFQTRQKSIIRRVFYEICSSQKTLTKEIVRMILEADTVDSFFEQYSHEFDYDNPVPIQDFGNVKFLLLKQVIERCLQKGSV